MKAFMRKNLMLIVSITLPLLVVLFFAIASILPGLLTTPPAYDLLISIQERGTSKPSQARLVFEVKEDKLQAVVYKTERPYYGDNPRLFRYAHASGLVSEVSIPVPGNIAELNDGSAIPISALNGLKVSDALQAPDGYEFRRRRGNGGLMTEMFGGSSNWSDVSIAKNGAIIRIRLPASDAWYTDVRFVGWVLE